jgi:CheY-like chemotaxis protein
MPGMDGFEVCRGIKSDPQTQSIKIIAVTAHPTPDAQKAIRDAGAEEYMPKPLDPDRLAGLIGALLARQR